ncbi:MAG: CbrC family protein [Phycisphaerales bacterium]
MQAPTFKYHPDPLASRSIVRSSKVCDSCGERRGLIYIGPVYGECDMDEVICPWCIADGSAHEHLHVEFVDCEAVDRGVSAAVLDEVCYRTPGYASWSGEHWPVCCGDACAFVAPMGIADLRALWRDAEGPLMSHVVHDLGVSGSAAVRLVESLRRDQAPTLMVFRCLRCEAPRFHIDMI